MYRKLRHQEDGDALDLDSLMDILSCLVGVMLFLVMYTVLELGSTAYQAQVLVGRDPHADNRRVMVLCEEGTVRLLDVRPPLDELLSGFDIVRTVPEVQLFVDANRSQPADAYFTYSLRHETRSTTDLMAMLDLVVEERPGAVGEHADELGEDSRYVAALDALSPIDTWLAFAVDSTSMEAFRVARELAIDRGFATGFDLIHVDFPLTLPLSRNGINDLLSPIGVLAKPQS